MIGDLAFGSTFDCLQTSTFHYWISIVFDNIKLSAFLRCTLYYPPFIRPLLRLLIPNYLTLHRENHMRMTREKALARLHSKSPRMDLLCRLVNPASGVTEAEFIQNCATVVVAGSDTTANVLAGTTHFLSQNPECYARLAHEVRSRFASEEEITLEAVNQLGYLTACLIEGMRRYPPTPAHLPRRTNMDDQIAGQMVPKDVCRLFLFLFPLRTPLKTAITDHCLRHAGRHVSHGEVLSPCIRLLPRAMDGRSRICI